MEPIGHVVNAGGEVFAESGGGPRPLAAGEPVFQGDEIVTGPAANVEIRFADDSILAQGPASRMSLDEFVYDQDGPEGSSLLYGAATGTFRLVTGKIAEANPDSVDIKTPLATIGIRGTGMDIVSADEGVKVGIFAYHKFDVVITTERGTTFLTDGDTIIEVFSDGSFGEPRPYTEMEKHEIEAMAPITSTGLIRGDDDENGRGDQGEDAGAGQGGGEEDETGEAGDDQAGDDQDGGDSDGQDGEEKAGDPPGAPDDFSALLFEEESPWDEDSLAGGHSDDSLPGGAGNDSLGGGDFGGGSDTLQAFIGGDSLSGVFVPEDDDNEIIGGAVEPEDAGSGSSLFFEGTEYDDSYLGTSGDETILGGSGNDYLYGGSGNDCIVGGAGVDSLYGGDGDDTFVFQSYEAEQGEIIDGGAGDNLMVVASNQADFSGCEVAAGSFSGIILAAGQTAVFSCGQLNGLDFRVQGDAGSNLQLNGGDGADLDLSGLDFGSFGGDGLVLDVNAGDIKLSLDKMPPGRMLKLQALNGGSLAGFNLQIIAPRGSSVDPAQLFDFGGSEPPGLDVVYDYGAPEGTGGNDFLVGTSNADLLEGLGGDDTLAGGPGADRLDGGPGSDWYAATAEGSSFAAISAGLFIDLPGGAATDPWGEADEISGISNVIGTDLADTFVGDDQSNILAAGGGDDSIEAGGGDDVVTAGGGSDTVDAAQGNDTVFGEAGNDTLDGGDGDDLLSGGSGRDDLDGGDGRDVLLGGDDDDYLHGNGGDDELYGGDGGDTLVGGENELDEDFTEQAVSSALDVGRALQAADFNNDGFQDLVYADEDFDVVGVHLNDGAGGFGPLILVDGSANGAHDVAVADVDGDGNADIAAAALYASRIYLYKGNGDGTFSPAQEISTMNGPYSLDSADVDGDGDMDLLTASWHSNNASLLQNNGDGTWTRSAVGNSGGRPVSLVAADLDGDGDLDALSAFMETNAIKWSMNTGGGVYGGWQLISNEVVDATDAKAADLDGDGDPDVVASSSGDDKVFWFENLGSGSFGPRKLISGEAENVRSVEAVDMDGDGDLDVLSASYDDGKLAWYENLGSGEFGPQQVIGSWAWLNDLIAADLDGDGDPDPAAVSENNLAVYYNNLAGRNDSLYGGAGDDSLTGNGGDDELYGGDGGDTLVGGFGADSLDGGFGADSLVGGAGNDTVAVENGSDYYDGGAGMDVLSFEFLGSVTFTLGAGGNGGISILESTQTYSGFEGLAGSSENDNLRGNSGDNVLFGGDGDDILFGFDGNDTLFGGAGVDSLYGGDGWDVVDYSLSDGPVKVDLMANDAETSSGTESFYSIEHAIGSDYDDSLIGNESGNSLFGGAGNDTLVVVGDQENVLSGGEGDDVIMIDRVGTDVANLVTDFDDGDGFAINAVNGAFTDPAFTTTQNESGGYLRVLIPRTSQILVDVSFNTFSYVTTTVFGGTSVIFSSVSTPIYDTHYGFSLSKVGSGSIPHLWTQNSWDRAVNGANSNFTMAETGVGFINTEGYLAAAFFKSDSEAWAVTKVESIATFSNGVDHTELEAADIFLY